VNPTAPLDATLGSACVYAFARRGPLFPSNGCPLWLDRAIEQSATPYVANTGQSESAQFTCCR
jgi:hypothetical protein